MLISICKFALSKHRNKEETLKNVDDKNSSGELTANEGEGNPKCFERCETCAIATKQKWREGWTHKRERRWENSRHCRYNSNSSPRPTG